jgi:hypothetical protein
MLGRRPFYLFQFPRLEKFISACQKIESDPNYQPHISNQELLHLIVDENGNPTHRGATPASNIEARSDGDSLGILYQIKVAERSPKHDDTWISDWSVVILVNKMGDYSFHNIEAAERGDFHSPLTHLNIDQFLNQRCLHYPEEKKTQTFNFRRL